MLSSEAGSVLELRSLAAVELAYSDFVEWSIAVEWLAESVHHPVDLHQQPFQTKYLENDHQTSNSHHPLD